MSTSIITKIKLNELIIQGGQEMQTILFLNLFVSRHLIFVVVI